jgi:hypothetical protein
LHACANFPIQARLSFARRTREFFVTNDEKYQTCLIFGLHVTNDENAVNVTRMHTRKFCQSNLSRITSTRDKCARVRRA